LKQRKKRKPFDSPGIGFLAGFMVPVLVMAPAGIGKTG